MKYRGNAGRFRGISGNKIRGRPLEVELQTSYYARRWCRVEPYNVVGNLIVVFWYTSSRVKLVKCSLNLCMVDGKELLVITSSCLKHINTRECDDGVTLFVVEE